MMSEELADIRVFGDFLQMINVSKPTENKNYSLPLTVISKMSVSQLVAEFKFEIATAEEVSKEMKKAVQCRQPEQTIEKETRSASSTLTNSALVACDWNPLMAAAAMGRIHCGRELLKNGADLTAANSRGQTPIILAAVYNQLDFIKEIFDRSMAKEVLNGTDKDGCTALHYAATFGHPTVVKHLLAIGVDATKTNNAGMVASDLCSLDEADHVMCRDILLGKSSRKRPAATSSSPDKRTSSLWNFFTLTDGFKAECKYCSVPIDRPHGSTTPMRRHLQRCIHYREAQALSDSDDVFEPEKRDKPVAVAFKKPRLSSNRGQAPAAGPSAPPAVSTAVKTPLSPQGSGSGGPPAAAVSSVAAPTTTGTGSPSSGDEQEEHLQIPSPDTVPQRKASILHPSAHSKPSPQPLIHHHEHNDELLSSPQN